MPVLVPRFIRWTVVLALIAALTTALFQHWKTWPHAIAIPTAPITTQANKWIQTPWGPFGPGERDLLIKIRQIDLCARSIGQQAQGQASSARIRTIGVRLITEYGDLDDQVRLVAGKLDISLPSQPSAQQQAWMKELSTLAGPHFDRTFAQELRYEYSEILPIIADVRAGTRNDLIRSLAATTTALVNQQSEYLRHTAAIAYSVLPEPLFPTTSNPSPDAPVASPGNSRQEVNAHSVNGNPTGESAVTVASSTAYVVALIGIGGLLYLLRHPSSSKVRRTRSPHRGYAAQRLPSPPGAR